MCRLRRGAGAVDKADDSHRVQLAELGRLVPDAWMGASCAVGSVDQCVRLLEEFRDAGADELATSGSTPQQNAGLVAAWRDRGAP